MVTIGLTNRRDGNSSALRGSLKYLLWGALMAGALYGLFFLLGFVVPATRQFTDKFVHRGWTPYVAVLLTFWCVSLFIEKVRYIRRRKTLMTDALLPQEVPLETDENVIDLITNARRQRMATGDDAFAPRVERLLEQYRSSGDPREVADLLHETTDVDLAGVHGSYSLARVFLWAIPILGFIGTVVGVGDAVGGFAAFLQRSTEIDEIKSALGGVTNGLSVAFDTTLVALLLSVVVMWFLSAVERAEQSLVRNFEEFCEERLVRRLPACKAAAHVQAAEPASGQVVELLRVALERVGPDSPAWRQQEERLARTLAEWTRQTLENANVRWHETLEAIRNSVAQNDQQQVEAVRRIADEAAGLRAGITGLLPQMQRLLESGQDTLTRTVSDQQARITDAVNKQHDQVQAYVGALSRAGAKLEELVQLRAELEKGLIRIAGSDGLAATLVQVREALHQMEPPIRRLAEKPIDVSVVFTAGGPAVGK